MKTALLCIDRMLHDKHSQTVPHPVAIGATIRLQGVLDANDKIIRNHDVSILQQGQELRHKVKHTTSDVAGSSVVPPWGRSTVLT